jgi:formamidopyrimidine-DNA glycosylase
MRQDLVAGLGNIYSDEVLYQAGIHPETPVQELKQEELVRIYEAMLTVIETAVEHQADPDSFPDWFLIPRRHAGGRCPVCSRELEVVEVSGRRGFACPGCQPRIEDRRKEVAGQASGA